ncbi:MAG: DoxX family protein [Ferruginibacter sp.]
MKNLLSTKYSAGAVSGAMLILRLGAGLLMINHGYDKLVHFGSMQNDFMNFMGIGKPLSLALLIFAEFFCSMFLILGLFTRLATIPLIIAMSIALFKAHNAEVFGKGELPALYLVVYIVLLLIGPGRVSVDSMTGK